MTDPLEVLNWHEERSDDSFKRIPELLYRCPGPLNLSAQQILDWMEEMRPGIEWQEGDDYVLSGVLLTVPEIGRTFGKTLDDAVCLAAAKWKRMNDEI